MSLSILFKSVCKKVEYNQNNANFYGLCICKLCQTVRMIFLLWFNRLYLHYIYQSAYWLIKIQKDLIMLLLPSVPKIFIVVQRFSLWRSAIITWGMLCICWALCSGFILYMQWQHKCSSPSAVESILTYNECQKDLEMKDACTVYVRGVWHLTKQWTVWSCDICNEMWHCK